MPSEGLRVLASPLSLGTDGNPYNDLLYDKVRDQGVTVTEFTRRALLDHPDVVHVHWPEFLVRWQGARRWAEIAKVLTLLALARRRGAALVWTGHDLEPHDSLPPHALRAFQAGFMPMVDLVISLGGPATGELRRRYPALAQTPAVVVPHGHYRPSFPVVPSRNQARRQLSLSEEATVLLTLGQLRRYKAVPALLRAFRDRPDPQLRMAVVGEPRDPGLSDELVEAAGPDARVSLVLHRVTSDAVAQWHAACDVVVLPYRQARSVLHSGAALLALSLNRPVVVNDTPTMRELQSRVGPSWVALSDGSAEGTLDAVGGLLAGGREEVAPLAELDWDRLAAETVSAYRSVVGRRHPPGGAG